MSLLKDITGLLGSAGPHSETRHREDLLATLLVMAWMVEARDPYTGGHLWRVSQFSRLLAARAGLDADAVSRITVGAFLHDLGKISVPDHILGKRGSLSEDEYAAIKVHPEVGWRMLSSHPLAPLAEAAIRAHHETPDGHGYPQGLAGQAIAVDARIVGLCDAFDAMTSTRPYRQGMPVAEALERIAQKLGSQFDAALGAHLIAMGQAGELDPIVGHSDAGIPMQLCLSCGPTIAMPRSHPAGMRLYCPSCSGEYEVQQAGSKRQLVPTGKAGTAAELMPRVDPDVLRDVVRASARALLA